MNTMYLLTMKRGRRAVKIGLFWTRHRTELVAVLLDWDPSWKPTIKVQEVNNHEH
jgi:hypothetical protein